MDSFEWNKIAGWVLAGALLVMAIGVLSESLVEPHELETNAYPIEVPEEGAAGAAAKEDKGPSMAMLLSQESAEDGERIFKKCHTCHTVGKGEPSGTGPNLYDVVGRDIGSFPGFGYSDGMAAKEGDWTYEKLDHFLTKPRDFVPGTKMAFAGLSRAEDRARVILYLRQHNDNPPPLPEVAEEKPAEADQAAAQPAEGDAAQQPAEGQDGEAPAETGQTDKN